MEEKKAVDLIEQEMQEKITGEIDKIRQTSDIFRGNPVIKKVFLERISDVLKENVDGYKRKHDRRNDLARKIFYSMFN